MKIEITENPTKKDYEFVINRTRLYNENFAENEFKLILIYFRNNENKIIAGLTGKTSWNWLHVEYLWVNGSERGKKIRE